MLPAEGEGRNAVFAVQKGWNVTAFDQSKAGQTKALDLARKLNVTIRYSVADILDTVFEAASFDAMGWIYCHLPSEIRSKSAQRLTSFLKPGAVLIFEAFSKEHITMNTSGPKMSEMLYDEEMIRNDFPHFTWQVLRKEKVILDEGELHQGISSVWRAVGIKN